MNTPGFNSRATAQMAMKALLHIMPDLPVDELHKRSSEGRFDTGRDLKLFPTSKLEGKRLAVIGYGNIGREFAKLGQAFGMQVAVHARPRHQQWIESEGFIFADHAEDAADGADVLSLHTGLGTLDAATRQVRQCRTCQRGDAGAAQPWCGADQLRPRRTCRCRCA